MVSALRIAAVLLVWLALSPSPALRAQNAVSGSGVVLVDVDYESGKVISARILKSLGSRVLDDSALATFRKWHFKPKTVRHVKIPVTFTLHR